MKFTLILLVLASVLEACVCSQLSPSEREKMIERRAALEASHVREAR